MFFLLYSSCFAKSQCFKMHGEKLFCYTTSPRRCLVIACLAKIRVSCQTFKMDIEKSFSLTPHFWPFKNHSTGQKSCFLIRRVLKCLFSYTTLSCFAKIRVSCQTFKMDIERSFSLTPNFWPFKKHSTGQKSCFLIRRVLKSLLSIWPSPRGLVLPK